MHLSRLHIHRVRNLQEIALTLHPQCNVFLGKNGSGKTSVLEAIYMLAVGRSFRSRQIQSVISYGQTSLSCFGEIIDENQQKTPMGIEKTRQGEVRCKVRGEACSRLSEFACLLPVQLVTPETFKLLLAGPQERRRFLDWGVFHVEPQFASACQRYQRLLKQRNASLKLMRQSTPWEREWVALGEGIHQYRKDYLEQLQPFIATMCHSLLPDLNFSMHYEPGWSSRLSLEEAMVAALSQDQRTGYTSVGPHIAELNIKVAGFPAQQVLSRGQLKLFICALYMAQAQQLQASLGKKCLYLIDDLASELDEDNRQRLLGLLTSQGHQVFLTGTDTSSWPEIQKTYPGEMFHVEQGGVFPSL